ncbi:carboxymuconolactone decarboxylase family protein [Paenibacillus sp. GCM10023252]|uniref:carboxymuconolactone decarboxylase family protein n=1 Tax=Paenibacillus sp. GCM10023252 TaxID=3252649 RepID=UPI00361E9B2A
MVQQRVNYSGRKSESLDILYSMEKYIAQSTISKTIRELIKIRASQLNKCAFCIDMHTTEARKAGESEKRIYGLNAWEDCPFYTEEERAALELTEHITLLSSKGVPDSLYEHVRNYFDEQQYVDLVLMISQINTWNRISIATGNSPK